ncbi:MAG TPA: SIR2 family protein [Candidatus Tumulicola sp.]|jgi:hypothetical protein
MANIQRTLAESRWTPYFFMVGAGLSFPSIPTASEIVKQCEQKYADLRASDERYPEPAAPSGNALDTYSYWLNSAFPDPSLLKPYLTTLVDSAYITPANLRLAHLLCAGKVANTAFTTNFDDLLTRSLDLFEQRYTLCDHPRTTERIQVNVEETQIVHIHGSFRFYDCANLKGRVQERRREDRATSSSMMSLLDRWLAQTAPIIIGYSGWANDVFMTAFRRRLKDPLRFTAYWFLHNRQQIRLLPLDVRNSEDITFVSSDESLINTDNPQANFTKVTLTDPVDQRIVDVSESLDAAEVLQELIKVTKAPLPSFVLDPLGSLAKKFSDVMPPTNDNRTADIYDFRHVVDQVQRARQLLLSDSPESYLNVFRKHLLELNEKLALQAANSLVARIPLLKADELKFLVVGLQRLGRHLQKEDQRRANELIEQFCWQLFEIHNDATLLEVGASALISEIVAAGQSARTRDLLEELINRYRAFEQTSYFVFLAQVGLGYWFEQHDESEQARTLYAQVAAALETSDRPIDVALRLDAEVRWSRLSMDFTSEESAIDIIRRYAQDERTEVRSKMVTLMMAEASYDAKINIVEAIKLFNEAADLSVGDLSRTAIEMIYTVASHISLICWKEGNLDAAFLILTTASRLVGSNPKLPLENAVELLATLAKLQEERGDIESAKAYRSDATAKSEGDGMLTAEESLEYAKDILDGSEDD